MSDSEEFDLEALIRQPRRISSKKTIESNVKRIGIYRRVSTREQADEGQSLMAQKAKIAKYLDFEPVFQEKELIITDFVDEGKSAKDLKRVALQQMITEVNANKIDFVVVVKLDRLTRRLSDLQYLTELFAKFNVTLLSINEKLDTQSATGRFFISILGSLAQLEREQISERVQDVFEQIVHNQPLGGFTPFGYFYFNRSNTKQHFPYLPEYCLEKQIPPIRVPGIDEDIWPGIYGRLIFEWFLSYKSYETIAKKLNNLHIPTPLQIYTGLKDFLSKSEAEQAKIDYLEIKKTKKWNRRTIQKILENPFYTGTRVWNRYENRLKRERPSNQWKIIKNTHPALISAKYFQQVRSVLLDIRRKIPETKIST